MAKSIVLYNSLANNGQGYENAKHIANLTQDEIEYLDITKIENLAEFFAKYEKDQCFILSGGDGTVNKFVNLIDEDKIPENLQYYPGGTGNDFYNDISNGSPEKKLIHLTPYLKNLPVATIDGKSYKFVDNVGYGIDGYVCEVADQLKEKSNEAINYTSIAIKGLLFGFKPGNAKVSVDGKEMSFKKVWLAPVMKGRYYGGGMIPCPNQDRSSGLCSLLVWHKANKFKTLMNFPKIFKGEHIKKAKMCECHTGKTFVVEFDKPCAAQIDGETILNVSKVEVKA